VSTLSATPSSSLSLSQESTAPSSSASFSAMQNPPSRQMPPAVTQSASAAHSVSSPPPLVPGAVHSAAGVSQASPNASLSAFA
jgi:hypothetical protein